MPTPEEFKSRLDALQGRIRKACALSGRDPASVRVLPVTKTHPAEFAAMAHAFAFDCLLARFACGIDGVSSSHFLAV